MDKHQIFMIVDDDDEDIALISEAIQRTFSHAKVVFAYDGDEALYKLRSGLFPRPNYLFLDLNMPRMGGRDFLSIIKKDIKLKDIPVIVITTSSSDKDEEDTRKLGAAHFMTKPCSFKSLCDEISKILDKLGKILHE